MFVGCTSQDSVDKPEGSAIQIAEEKPADTSGATASTEVRFGGSGSESFLLEGEADGATDSSTTAVPIDENVSLNYAKLNIAKIRFKPKKELSAEEKGLEEQDNKEEQKLVEELDQLLGDAAVGLVKPDSPGNSANAQGQNKTAKETKAERMAKLKEKLAALHAKQKEKAEKEAASDKNIKLTGPYVYDAIVGKTEGEPLKVDIADGAYRRVDFQLKRNFTLPESELLLGNVFAMKGNVKIDGKSVPFEIEWHVAVNFRLAGDTPFAVKVGEDNVLSISFDLKQWFQGIDLTKASVDADGTIYVNKKSNKDIMRALHRNMKLGAGFGKDANGNGKLDKDEVVGTGQEAPDAATP